MSNKEEKSNLTENKCLICGDDAFYYYFGVKSCSPCKIFFKRNANLKQKELKCIYDGKCQINVNNRHICSSCRLDKCFKSGMTLNKSRQSKIHQKQLILKKSSILIEDKNPKFEIRPINILEKDQSLLTKDEWILLTNLFNCYEESSILIHRDYLINEDQNLQLNEIIYESLVEQFLISVYSASGSYLSSNNDIKTLSYDTRWIFLRNAADNLTCMGGGFIMQYYQLYSLRHFLNFMINKYGISTMNIHLWARKFLDQDIVLIKLTISLFAFSQNPSTYSSNHLNNSIEIYHIQNKYIELTWKYLLYKYGLQISIQKMMNITLWITSMNRLANHAQSLQAHINDIQQIIDKTEITLIVDDLEQIIQSD